MIFISHYTGIQQYLYENGRIDNIFTDTYYERFTDCLDEVARKFSVLYNDSRKFLFLLVFDGICLMRFLFSTEYIVTRVEEEHLWECKQLGAHSPHVLLSTLMFFNTKHFNLTVCPINKYFGRLLEGPIKGLLLDGHIEEVKGVALDF